VEILYTRSGEVSLAYAVEGTGLPLIYITGIVSNLAMEESNPALAVFYERLARFCRLVRWDRRGTGLSDQSADPLPLTDQALDLEVIRAAVGFERFALVGYSHGTTLAARYAVENPDRVSHLALISPFVCDARDPFDPASPRLMPPVPRDHWELRSSQMAEFLASAGAPGLDAPVRHRTENFIKASVNPRGMGQLMEQVREADLREVFPAIRVPTLVVHPSRDRLFPIAHGRYAAERIRGARFVEPDSDFHIFSLDPATRAQVVTALEEFLTGSVSHTADRVMASVLFTDIVDSTAAQQRVGDEAWRDLRKSFEADTQHIVEQFGGRVVQFTGDGVMASFSAASQALRAGRALAADARGLGVQIRAGVHAGEAYTVEGQLFGTCVTVAARVAAHAGPNELFTTETVSDLVAGADFAFRDAGVFELKGLGSRRLLSVSA
jgi:pimeloyl-ACP methyl ester carboxylesterase